MSTGHSWPIQRILIANRGEIALRIMKACKELNIETVAVYGDGEATATHVRYADHAFRIAPPSGLPYLATAQLIDAAKRANAQAIHPGYGFLAENHQFARAVNEAGLTLIGPSAESIATMGDKIQSRKAAEEAGVGPVPGTSSPVETVSAALRWGEEHGYPVAVKAAGGGGGRGFRVARTPAEIENAFHGARGEAERYFDNPAVYLERYLNHPRHIEVQVFGDFHGNIVAFGERDCSVQRRHQKLIEESPSPVVTAELRRGLQSASIALATSVSYVGAGTIEFLLDDDGQFFFLEMNTRIQVEHTVTEMVTGIDLVKEQIGVASGEPLSFTQDDCEPQGWAIECRVNAEDAGRNFSPAPGTIGHYREPSGFGLRVDGAFRAGDEILPAYDSLIAKVIAWGRDRDEAIARMRRALSEFEIGGLATTIPFHARVLENDTFLAGGASTTFVDTSPDVLPPPYEPGSDDALMRQRVSPPDERLSLLVEVNGRRFETSVIGLSSGQPRSGRRNPSRSSRRRNEEPNHPGTGDDLTTAVKGTVIRVAVEEGADVRAGDLVCVIEAMKMENEIVAHRSGNVATIHVAQGDSIAAGAAVATIVSTPT